MIVEREKIRQELEIERLKFEDVGAELGMWAVSFQITPDQAPQSSFLFQPGESDYFVIMSPIISTPIGNLDSILLQRLIIVASEVPLAKIEYSQALDDSPETSAEFSSGLFFASSRCSVEGFTGKKLRRRLEACADLAARAEKVFGLKPSTF